MENNNQLKIGDTFKFGKYFIRDANNKDDIKWNVLDQDDETILAISEYCLETMNYFNHLDSIDFNWETSLVRNFLNGEFYEQAFSEKEKQAIVKREIKTGVLVTHFQTPIMTFNDLPVWDRVSILDIEEAKKYFNSNFARSSLPTKYLRNKISHKTQDGAYVTYWLRNTTYFEPLDLISVLAVLGDGSAYGEAGFIMDGGITPDSPNNDNGIRPVILLKKAVLGLK